MVIKRQVGLVVAATALLVAVAGVAGAQGFGMRRGAAMGGVQLLTNKSVQDELKLTADEITKVEAKSQEIRGAMRDAFQNNNGDQDAMMKAMAKVQEQSEKAAADILTPDQLKRFHEIEIQLQGPAALTRGEIQEALKVTDDQKKKIADINDDMRAQMRNARQGVDFSDADARQKMFDKIQSIQKESNEKFLAVLTDDQKDQFKKMQGEPFKLVIPPPRQGA